MQFLLGALRFNTRSGKFQRRCKRVRLAALVQAVNMRQLFAHCKQGLLRADLTWALYCITFT
jgi:hypothetical protein